MITTSPEFPNDVAVECLDEFYEIFRQVRRRSWSAKDRAKAQEACCKGIAMKYGTLEVGSASHMIITEIQEDARSQYSNSIRDLMDQVDKLKDEMAENIVEALKKGENLDHLLEMSSELLEQAKVFRKQAKKLEWTMWAKKNKVVLIGTTCFSAAGAALGFMAGGPDLAVLFTDPFFGAQAIEASITAVIFGAGFLGARSAMQSWFWNQPFVVL
jgi:Synaptobrevin